MDPILIALLKLIQAKFERQKWGSKHMWSPGSTTPAYKKPRTLVWNVNSLHANI